MPRRAARPCNHPGCPALVTDRAQRLCAEHLREYRTRQDAARGSSTERGYDSTWRATRDRYLTEHPICERCKRARSEDVHHIVPKRRGGSDEPINLQALCGLCHRQVEAKLGTLFGGHRGREY